MSIQTIKDKIPQGIDIIVLSIPSTIYIFDSCGIKNKVIIHDKIIDIYNFKLGILIRSENSLYYLSLINEKKDIEETYPILNEIDIKFGDDDNLTPTNIDYFDHIYIDNITGLVITIKREEINDKYYERIYYMGHIENNKLDLIVFDLPNGRFENNMEIYLPVLGTKDVNDILVVEGESKETNSRIEYKEYTAYTYGIEGIINDKVIFWQPPYIFTEYEVWDFSDYKLIRKFVSKLISYTVEENNIIMIRHNEDDNSTIVYLVRFENKLPYFEELFSYEGDVFSTTGNAFLVSNGIEAEYTDDKVHVPLFLPKSNKVILMDIRYKFMMQNLINESDILNKNTKNIVYSYT